MIRELMVIGEPEDGFRDEEPFVGFIDRTKLKQIYVVKQEREKQDELKWLEHSVIISKSWGKMWLNQFKIL